MTLVPMVFLQGVANVSLLGFVLVLRRGWGWSLCPCSPAALARTVHLPPGSSHLLSWEIPGEFRFGISEGFGEEGAATIQPSWCLNPAGAVMGILGPRKAGGRIPPGRACPLHPQECRSTSAGETG